jgi:hypothetical protein
MRFSSAYILAVAAALASSVSATPIDAGAEWCTVFCEIDSQCNCNERVCVSFSDLRARFNHNVLWHGRPSLCAGWVRVVFLLSHQWNCSMTLTRELLVIKAGRWVDQCFGFWTIFTATWAIEILEVCNSLWNCGCFC